MDHSANSASLFHKLADRYRDKYMSLTMYDDSYREFCQALRPGRARVLDAACGPGAASRYILSQRPDLDVLGIDLAPRMVELARETAPSAQFAVHDCRHLAELKRRFDGIICAFGLPYLLPEELTTFIAAADAALDSGGVLYLSTMLGDTKESGFERCSSGDEVYINYHDEEELIALLEQRGFKVFKRNHIPSPSTAVKQTTDLIVIARK